MENTCKHCHKRIVKMNFAIGSKWVHKPEGGSFHEGYVTYCEMTAAEPVDEDEDNKKAFEEETRLANSILRRNRYNTQPPYQWYGPEPEPVKKMLMTHEEFEAIIGDRITNWQWKRILEWRRNND